MKNHIIFTFLNEDPLKIILVTVEYLNITPHRHTSSTDFLPCQRLSYPKRLQVDCENSSTGWKLHIKTFIFSVKLLFINSCIYYKKSIFFYCRKFVLKKSGKKHLCGKSFLDPFLQIFLKQVSSKIIT